MSTTADEIEASAEAGADPTARRERADAARNRARILEAARDAFAREGLSCQIDEIARQACVGTGTIYRNFPTKQALLEAILVDNKQRLTARARAESGASDPVVAFLDFVAAMVRGSCANKALSATLTEAGIDVKKATAGASAELHEAVDVLLQRAKDAGGVRPDILVPDLMALLAGTCNAASQYDANPDWLIQVLQAGLRPANASPA
ncbi:MAG: helix-turn-helix transcriptional regulator [Chloroflexi bacterium]|nr:helix-turn-helix transcriptional regulator [Chloroflexota bacterium]